MIMLHNILGKISKRMKELETLAKRQRGKQIPDHLRLKQIAPETGRFLAFIAGIAPKGRYLEIGTSAGYSALWLSLACREKGCKLITFEILQSKAQMARETFRKAGVEDVVRLVVGDARSQISKYKNIGFCFLDAEKDLYLECYDMIIPNLIKGGLLVADNVISHKTTLKLMLKRVFRDNRVDAIIVPIGSGALICRKL
jgi:predicted O-methyltransferase YrrM